MNGIRDFNLIGNLNTPLILNCDADQSIIPFKLISFPGKPMVKRTPHASTRNTLSYDHITHSVLTALQHGLLRPMQSPFFAIKRIYIKTILGQAIAEMAKLA